MTLSPFRNEPVLELRRAAERTRLAGALDALELPVRVPVWIGDERRDGEELRSTDRFDLSPSLAGEWNGAEVRVENLSARGARIESTRPLAPSAIPRAS